MLTLYPGTRIRAAQTGTQYRPLRFALAATSAGAALNQRGTLCARLLATHPSHAAHHDVQDDVRWSQGGQEFVEQEGGEHLAMLRTGGSNAQL